MSLGSERSYLTDLREFITLSELGYIELDQYQRMVEVNYDKSTARKKITLVRSLLKFGVETNFFERDLRSSIRMPEKDKRARVERKLIKRFNKF